MSLAANRNKSPPLPGSTGKPSKRRAEENPGHDQSAIILVIAEHVGHLRRRRRIFGCRIRTSKIDREQGEEGDTSPVPTHS